MIIDKRREKNVTYLYVRGELDSFDADELKEEGIDALRPNSNSVALRINLSGVTFISSRGLAALITIRNDALPAHTLVLENPSPVILRVLTVSGLDAVFNIE